MNNLVMSNLVSITINTLLLIMPDSERKMSLTQKEMKEKAELKTTNM